MESPGQTLFAVGALNPAFVLEVAVAPSVFDTDVCCFDFVGEPFIDYRLAFGSLIHIFDSLIIFGEVGPSEPLFGL